MQLVTALQQQTTNKSNLSPETPVRSGLTVQTNLRAGLAWDDLDDQAAAYWKKFTDSFATLTADNNNQTTSK